MKYLSFALALALPLTATARDFDSDIENLGGGAFRISWQSTPSNPGDATLFYYAFQLQGSTDLENWINIESPIPTRIGGVIQEESITLTNPAHKFFRLNYEVDLSGQDFSGSDFSSLDLSAANLSGTDFSNADLSGATLLDAELSGTILNGSDLTDTLFSPLTEGQYDLSVFGGLGSALVVNLPSLPSYNNPADFVRTVPGFEDLLTSETKLVVRPKATTTVAQFNTFLANHNGTVVGSIGQPLGLAEPIVAVKFPTDAANIRTLQATLSADPIIQSVILDLVEVPETLPSYTEGRHRVTDWDWGIPANGGAYVPLAAGQDYCPWGHLRTNVPSMWNLNDGIEKLFMERGTEASMTPHVVVADTGINRPHRDMANVKELNKKRSIDPFHGTFVCGIIGAEFTNHRSGSGWGGIEGLDPFANLSSVTYLEGGFTFDSNILMAWTAVYADCRVINMSFGIPWRDDNDVPIPLNTRPDVRSYIQSASKLSEDILNGLNAAGSPLFVVKAAGNDGIDSRWGGPTNFLARDALRGGTDHVLVVGAQSYNSSIRANFSNSNTDILAPGESILSSVPIADGGYGLSNGTSFAAPYVAGLASYLLNINPDLTNLQLKRLLTRDRIQPPGNFGGNAIARMDAFASLMLLDTIAPPPERTVLQMLLDVDDGTPDGNLRQRYDPPQFYIVSNPPTRTDYVKEWTTDVNDPGGLADPGSIALTLPGDGVIDMSDFRKWRDHYQFGEEAADLMLDGGPGHIKLDANRNGLVDHPTVERRYARTDFNGDGVLGSMAHPETGKTDFDILVESGLWTDPHVTLPDLPFLIQSGDLRIVLTDTLVELAPSVDTMKIIISGGSWNKTRTVDINDGTGRLDPAMSWNFHHRDLLVTLPVGTHTVRVEIFAPPPATGAAVIFERSIPVGLCEDTFFMVDYGDEVF